MAKSMKMRSIALVAAASLLFPAVSCRILEDEGGRNTSNGLLSSAAQIRDSFIRPVCQTFWHLWIFDNYLNPPEGGVDELAYKNYLVSGNDGVYMVNPYDSRYSWEMFQVNVKGGSLTDVGSEFIFVPVETEGHIYCFRCVGENAWEVSGINIATARLEVTAIGANSLSYTLSIEGECHDNDVDVRTFVSNLSVVSSYGQTVADTNTSLAGRIDVNFTRNGKVLDWAWMEWDETNYNVTTCTSKD